VKKSKPNLHSPDACDVRLLGYRLLDYYPLNGRLRDVAEIGIFRGGKMHARHTALLERMAKA
jgi:hypothetical protein